MSRNVRILSILRSPDDYVGLRNQLPHTVFEISYAATATAALAFAELHRFDLIVVRHPLPDSDTSEFFSALCKLPYSAHTPVVFWTRLSQFLEIGWLKQEGVVIVRAGEKFLVQAMLQALQPAARKESHPLAEIDNRLYQAHDLSETGVFLATQAPRPVGSELRIGFRLDGPVPVEVSGAVVRRTLPGHSRRPGMAIQFSRLADNATNRLTAFLSEIEAYGAA